MTMHLQPEQGSYVAPSFEHATVRDAMRHEVVTITPDAPAVDLARLMATRHIHAVVVAGVHRDATGEHLRWGVVSEAELLRAAGGAFEGLTAGEVAVAGPVTVAPSATLAEAAHTMAEAGVTHLVIAESGRPVGVLSTLDIAGVLAWGRG
jgi:CBS domain-containing protein